MFERHSSRLQRMGRYGQIINVLLKYGFEDVISRLDLGKYARLKKPQVTKKGTRWERLRMAFEELGPTFVKFGQLISNRGDLFPGDLVKELEKLQEKVLPFPAGEAVKLIEKELNQPVDALFKSFFEQTEASASIAQVHRAVLHSGEEVAVKIQRPHIEKLISVDIDIMQELASLIESYFPKAKPFQLPEFIREFEHSIKKELDFRLEAANLLRFRRSMKPNELCVPEYYPDYSTGRVLTMQYIDGIRISNTERLKREGYNLSLIARKCIKIYYRQVIDLGFFHADPHPGNIIVTAGNRICFVDFGITGIVLKRDKELITSFIIGLQSRDTRRIVRILQELSQQEIPRMKKLEYRLGEIIEQYSYQALSQINVGEVNKKLRDIMLEFNIQAPPNFFLLIKTLALAESIVKKLDPHLDIASIIKPYGKKLVLERLNPVSIAKDLFLTTLDLQNLIRDIPADAEDLIKKIKEGKINVHLEHHRLENLVSILDTVSNRISLAIILAALLIASSLLVLSNIPPHWNDISLIGIIGYLISGLLGLMLIISIFKKKNY